MAATIRRFESFLLTTIRELLPGFLGACTKGFFLAPCPLLLKRIIDVYAPHHDLLGMAKTLGFCTGLIALYVTAALWSGRRIVGHMSRRARRMMGEIADKLGMARTCAVGEHFTTDLHSVFFTDVQKVENGLTYVINNFLPTVLYAFVMTLLLCVVEWRIGMLVIGLMGLLGLARFYFMNRLRAAQQSETGAQKQLMRTFDELANGHDFLRAISSYAEFAEGTKRQIENYGAASFVLGFTRQKLLAALHLVQQSMNIVIVCAGAVSVIYFGESVTVLIAALLMLPVIFAPLQLLPEATDRYTAAKQAFGRISSFLALPEEPKEGKIIRCTGPLAVTLKQVTFRYPQATRDAVREISCTIEAGQMVAMVGGSGGGKTTLASLILGLHRPDAGRIKIDGLAMNEINLAAYRRHVGYVSQNPVIFNDTIAQNIRIGSPRSTMTEIRAVAEMAQAHTFITTLSDGYDTPVGERGSKLSGGQRQRIALARALIRNPALLVLDEATSALDEETEQAIQKALANIRGRHTVLVIAHRLATIRNADSILVINEGRLEDVLSPEQWISRVVAHGGMA